jgi:hypothetical protein
MPISPVSPGRQAPVRLRIEDDHGIGGQRHPDRHRPVRVQQRPRRGHGCLGGAIHVEETPARPVPAGDQVLRTGLPGHQQDVIGPSITVMIVYRPGTERSGSTGHMGASIVVMSGPPRWSPQPGRRRRLQACLSRCVSISMRTATSASRRVPRSDTWHGAGLPRWPAGAGPISAQMRADGV